MVSKKGSLEAHTNILQSVMRYKLWLGLELGLELGSQLGLEPGSELGVRVRVRVRMTNNLSLLL
jgi:hypothetical protein